MNTEILAEDIIFISQNTFKFFSQPFTEMQKIILGSS